MEIDAEKFKNIVVFSLEKLRELETELLAHQSVLFTINVVSPEAMVNQSLEVARKHPAIQQKMEEKYGALVEECRKHIDAATLDQEVSKWILKWKRTDPVN